MPNRSRVVRSLFIVITLAVALPVGVYLVQRQVKIRSLADGPNICTWETCGDINTPEGLAAWNAGAAAAEGNVYTDDIKQQVNQIVDKAEQQGQQAVEHIEQVVSVNTNDAQKAVLADALNTGNKQTLSTITNSTTITPPTNSAVENVCYLPGYNCLDDKQWHDGVMLAKKPADALKDPNFVRDNPGLIANLEKNLKDTNFVKNNPSIVNALLELKPELKSTVSLENATATSISPEATALRDAKTKECSVTLGLCPMIDPVSLKVVGWVPSDKAVFGTFTDAIVARSGLSIGDATKTITIEGKNYKVYDPTYTLKDANVNVTEVKKIADQQKIDIDSAGRIIIDPKKYDLAKIQTQVNDFQTQQAEAEKAIANQAVQTGDLTNIKYLPEATQKAILEQIKNNEAVKRAADAALRGDNSGREKLSDADQARVDEIVKNSQDQQAKLNNKINAILQTPEDEEVILSGLSTSEITIVKAAVEKEKTYRAELPKLIENYQNQLNSFVSGNCLVKFESYCDSIRVSMSSAKDKIRSQDFENIKAEVAAIITDKNPTLVVQIFDHLSLSDDQRNLANKKIQEYSDKTDRLIGAIDYLAAKPEVTRDILLQNFSSQEKVIINNEVNKAQAEIKAKEQKLTEIKTDLELAKQATTGNKTFDDAVKIVTNIANGEIKTDTVAKLIYRQITQTNRSDNPLSELLSLRPDAKIAKITLSDPTLPQNQNLITRSLEKANLDPNSPDIQLKLKENYYTDLVTSYYSASDKSSCVWGVSSGCDQVKREIDKYKTDLSNEQVRDIYKQALIKNITNLDNNSTYVKDTLLKTLKDAKISDLESDVDKTLIKTTNLGIKDWQDYQKLNDNWTYLAYSYGSGQQFSANIQKAIESGQIKPADMEKHIEAVAWSDPITSLATAYNIFTQGGAQRNLASQSVGYEQKRQEYIQKYNVDPGYDPTKSEYWKANAEAWAQGLVNTVPVVTNGVIGLFDQEAADKAIPVTEYQRNSADYVRAGVAFAAPAASVIAPIAALPFAPLGVVGILTTGQTAFGSYASLGSLGNTAELCTFRPDMDRVGCGLAFGNTVYMVGNTISGLARGTISIAEAQIAKDVALVNKDTTYQQVLKIVKGGAGVKAAALNAGSPVERIAYSLSSGAGAATFIPKALLSCTGAATQQQGASWADCIVSGTMGGASVFRSLNLFLPFTRNDTLGTLTGRIAEIGDQLDGFASCADLSFNPGNKNVPNRFNPFECALGIYDAYGDNLAGHWNKGEALFGQQDRSVTNGSFAKLQAAVNDKDEALIKQYTAEAISNLGHLKANNIEVSADLSDADIAIDRLKQEYQKQFLLNISKDIKNSEIEKLRTSLNATTNFPTVALELTTAILTNNPKIFAAEDLTKLQHELETQISNINIQVDQATTQTTALQQAAEANPDFAPQAQTEINRLQAFRAGLEELRDKLFGAIAAVGTAGSQVTQAPPPAAPVTGDSNMTQPLQETGVKTWQQRISSIPFIGSLISRLTTGVPVSTSTTPTTPTQQPISAPTFGEKIQYPDTPLGRLMTDLSNKQNPITNTISNRNREAADEAVSLGIIAFKKPNETSDEFWNRVKTEYAQVQTRISQLQNEGKSYDAARTQAVAEKKDGTLPTSIVSNTAPTAPAQAQPTNFIEYFLNGKRYTDPSLPKQLLSDHFSIKSKYDLPKRDIRFENPSEYIQQLREISRKNNIPIRDKSEFQQFFDENPIAGAVYDDKGRQIFVNLSKDPIALAGDLEHELIHALQHIKYPGLPIELQEYEAYVGANMRTGEDFLNDPENIANVFGAIGSSIKNWYENEKLSVPWRTTQQSLAQTTTSQKPNQPIETEIPAELVATIPKSTTTKQNSKNRNFESVFKPLADKVQYFIEINLLRRDSIDYIDSINIENESGVDDNTIFAAKLAVATVLIQNGLLPTDITLKFVDYVIDSNTGNKLDTLATTYFDKKTIAFGMKTEAMNQYQEFFGKTLSILLASSHEATHIAQMRKGDIPPDSNSLTPEEYSQNRHELEAWKSAVNFVKKIRPSISGSARITTNGYTTELIFPEISDFKFPLKNEKIPAYISLTANQPTSIQGTWRNLINIGSPLNNLATELLSKALTNQLRTGTPTAQSTQTPTAPTETRSQAIQRGFVDGFKFVGSNGLIGVVNLFAKQTPENLGRTAGAFVKNAIASSIPGVQSRLNNINPIDLYDRALLRASDILNKINTRLISFTGQETTFNTRDTSDKNSGVIRPKMWITNDGSINRQMTNTLSDAIHSNSTNLTSGHRVESAWTNLENTIPNNSRSKHVGQDAVAFDNKIGEFIVDVVADGVSSGPQSGEISKRLSLLIQLSTKRFLQDGYSPEQAAKKSIVVSLEKVREEFKEIYLDEQDATTINLTITNLKTGELTVANIGDSPVLFINHENGVIDFLSNWKRITQNGPTGQTWIEWLLQKAQGANSTLSFQEIEDADGHNISNGLSPFSDEDQITHMLSIRSFENLPTQYSIISASDDLIKTLESEMFISPNGVISSNYLLQLFRKNKNNPAAIIKSIAEYNHGVSGFDDMGIVIRTISNPGTNMARDLLAPSFIEFTKKAIDKIDDLRSQIPAKPVAQIIAAEVEPAEIEVVPTAPQTPNQPTQTQAPTAPTAVFSPGIPPLTQNNYTNDRYLPFDDTIVSEGIEIYKIFLNALPENIRSKVVLNYNNVEHSLLSVFAGFTPKSSIYYSIRNSLNTEEEKLELDKIFDKSTKGKIIRVRRDAKDYTSILNLAAAEKVASYYPDLFPIGAERAEKWFKDHKDEWITIGDDVNLIRHGVLSGFPRDASEKFIVYTNALSKIWINYGSRPSQTEDLARYYLTKTRVGQFISKYVFGLSSEEIKYLNTQFDVPFINGRFEGFIADDKVWSERAQDAFLKAKEQINTTISPANQITTPVIIKQGQSLADGEIVVKAIHTTGTPDVDLEIAEITIRDAKANTTVTVGRHNIHIGSITAAGVELSFSFTSPLTETVPDTTINKFGDEEDFVDITNHKTILEGLTYKVIRNNNNTFSIFGYTLGGKTPVVVGQRVGSGEERSAVRFTYRDGSTKKTWVSYFPNNVFQEDSISHGTEPYVEKFSQDLTLVMLSPNGIPYTSLPSAYRFLDILENPIPLSPSIAFAQIWTFVSTWRDRMFYSKLSDFNQAEIDPVRNSVIAVWDKPQKGKLSIPHFDFSKRKWRWVTVERLEGPILDKVSPIKPAVTDATYQGSNPNGHEFRTRVIDNIDSGVKKAIPSHPTPELFSRDADMMVELMDNDQGFAHILFRSPANSEDTLPIEGGVRKAAQEKVLGVFIRALAKFKQFNPNYLPKLLVIQTKNTQGSAYLSFENNQFVFYSAAIEDIEKNPEAVEAGIMHELVHHYYAQLAEDKLEELQFVETYPNIVEFIFTNQSRREYFKQLEDGKTQYEQHEVDFQQIKPLLIRIAKELFNTNIDFGDFDTLWNFYRNLSETEKIKAMSSIFTNFENGTPISNFVISPAANSLPQPTIGKEELTTKILGVWGFDLQNLPNEIKNLITDFIFDPGFSGELPALNIPDVDTTAYVNKYKHALNVLRSIHLPALLAAGGKVVATVDIPGARSRNDVLENNWLNGDYYFRAKIAQSLAANPGTVAVRVDGDKFVFVSFDNQNTFKDSKAFSYVKTTKGIEYTDNDSEFHVLTNDKTKSFSTENIDIEGFLDHHPEFKSFQSFMTSELQKFLIVAFEDQVLNNPNAYRDYKHMLVHLQATGQTEFTVTKIDTPVYIKTQNDIVSEQAGDEAIRKLARLNPGATIFRDGAQIYFVTPKGQTLKTPQDEKYILTYPDGTQIEYPLKFFVSSSDFVLTPSIEPLSPSQSTIEAFNQTRSITSGAIQFQVDKYINSLPADHIWLRNIYFNPLTSRGLANLKAAGKTDAEIDELKTHYVSAGLNTLTGKEAWVWKDPSKKDAAQKKLDDQQKLRGNGTIKLPAFQPTLLLPAGPVGQLILPLIAQSLISQTSTTDQTPSTDEPAAKNPNQLSIFPDNIQQDTDLTTLANNISTFYDPATLSLQAGNLKYRIDNGITSAQVLTIGDGSRYLLTANNITNIIDIRPEVGRVFNDEQQNSVKNYLRVIFPNGYSLNVDKKIVAAPPAAASNRTVFQKVAVELSRPIFGPAADAAITTLEIVNRKPTPTVTATEKRNLAQQVEVNVPVADESQPTTTTTTEPGQRAAAPKISQPVSKFEDFVKRVEEAFPTPKEQPKLTLEQLELLAKYHQSQEYAKYLLGLLNTPVPQPELATPEIIEAAKNEIVRQIERKVTNPLDSSPNEIDEMNAENALNRLWQQKISERRKLAREQRAIAAQIKADQEAGDKLAKEIYADYLNSQKEQAAIDAEKSKVPTNDSWFVLALLKNFQSNISDHLLPKDTPLNIDDFKDFFSAQRFVLTGEYPRVVNIENKLPSHRINLDTILVTKNQEKILKENIADPNGPILTLMRTGKSARAAIEKALLAVTNLKSNNIAKVADETEAAIKEAMERMYIEYIDTHLANLPADNPWAYQIATNPLPQYVAHQNAVKALKAQKLKEAAEEAARTKFLTQLKTENVTRTNFLQDLDKRIVAPISNEVNKLLAGFEKTRFLAEDTDRFRAQLKAEAARPITSIAPTEALSIADIVYRFSAKRKLELDLLRVATEQRSAEIPTYEPAPVIDFLATRRDDISNPVHEYVAGLLQDFETQAQAARQSDQRAAQQNNLQWLNLGEIIDNTPAQTTFNLNEVFDQTTFEELKKKNADILEAAQNQILALQAKAVYQNKQNRLGMIAAALYPEVARTLKDQRNQETIRNLSLDPELMRNINSDAILKIVNGDIRLAAIIENNLRTAKPLWDFMLKNDISTYIPFEDWLRIADNFNKFKFVYDGQLKLDSIKRAALLDIRLDILGSTVNTELEDALVNKYTTEHLSKLANESRRKILDIRQNMSTEEVSNILKTLREDPILGILMTEKAATDVATKNAAKAAKDAAEAEVSTKKSQPKVTKPSSLAQKLLDLIPSPAMRRNALLVITTVGVISVAVITAIRGNIVPPAAQATISSAPQYVVRPDERNIGPVEAPVVIPAPIIENVYNLASIPETQSRLDNGCFVIRQVKTNDKDIPLLNVISYPDKNPQDLNEYCSKNIKYFKEIGIGKAKIDATRVNVFKTDKGNFVMLKQDSVTCFLFSSAMGFDILYQQTDSNNVPTIFDITLLPEILDIPFDQYDKEYNTLLQDEFMIRTYVSDQTLKDELLKNPKLVQQNISDPRLNQLKSSAMLGIINLYIQKDRSFAAFLSKIGIEWRNKEIDQLIREDPSVPTKVASNAKKELLLNNVKEDMGENNLVYLGMLSGPLTSHSYIVNGIDQIDGKTYLHLLEANAASTGPASWGYYKDIKRLPDNSLLMSIDDAVNNFVSYKIMSRTLGGQAMLKNKDKTTKSDSSTMFKQPIRISSTGNPQAKVIFSDDVKILPPETYSNSFNPAKLIKPTTVVIHYANNSHPDGTPLPPQDWTTSSIYNGLTWAKSSSHFGIGSDGTITQFLPMTEEMVQKSFAAGGDANEYTINIEMGGNKQYFEKLMVPGQETDATIDLVINLMAQYNISFDKIVGHQDVKYTNGMSNSKIDPTPEYMAFFKEKLSERINALGYDLGQPKTIANTNTPTSRIDKIAMLP